MPHTVLTICLIMWSILVDCDSWDVILIIEVGFLRNLKVLERKNRD
jgi:hypothetical protein